MSGYKHPCKYCGKLIEPDANVCPFCGKVNPIGLLRCPKCEYPIQKDYKVCPNCGLKLEITCPYCGEQTFFGDYCDKCGTRLLMICSNRKCKIEQPPIEENCIKCGKPLKKIH